MTARRLLAIYDIQYGWWSDKNNNKRYYWDGNGSNNAHRRSCGLQGDTCTEHRYY